MKNALPEYQVFNVDGRPYLLLGERDSADRVYGVVCYFAHDSLRIVGRDYQGTFNIFSEDYEKRLRLADLTFVEIQMLAQRVEFDSKAKGLDLSLLEKLAGLEKVIIGADGMVIQEAPIRRPSATGDLIISRRDIGRRC